MKSDLILQDITTDLTGTFICSSWDALERAHQVAREGVPPTGVTTVFEQQAAIECSIASFLGIEATLNRIFYDQIRGKTRTAFDRWLHERWKAGLRVQEKLELVLSEYAKTDFSDFPVLKEIFVEMTSFRNSLVHTAPQDYEMLIEGADENWEKGTTSSAKSILIASKGEPARKYPRTSFSSGLLSIGYADAAKSHEIMTLMVAFLDARFGRTTTLILNANQKGRVRVEHPATHLAKLSPRYFKIDPPNFI